MASLKEFRAGGDNRAVSPARSVAPLWATHGGIIAHSRFHVGHGGATLRANEKRSSESGSTREQRQH
jgi:hypothetical protein